MFHKKPVLAQLILLLNIYKYYKWFIYYNYACHMMVSKRWNFMSERYLKLKNVVNLGFEIKCILECMPLSLNEKACSLDLKYYWIVTNLFG